MNRVNSVSCFLYGYSNRSEKLHYFRFPKDPSRRNLWLKSCNLPQSTETKSARLCHKHFIESDFIQNVKRTNLKSNAFPSIFFDTDKVQNNRQLTKEPTDVELKKSDDNLSCLKRSNLSCCVCHHSYYLYAQSTEKVSFFRLPKNEDERRKWVKELKIDPTLNLNNVRVCSKHVTLDNFHGQKRKKLILENDVPHKITCTKSDSSMNVEINENINNDDNSLNNHETSISHENSYDGQSVSSPFKLFRDIGELRHPDQTICSNGPELMCLDNADFFVFPTLLLDEVPLSADMKKIADVAVQTSGNSLGFIDMAVQTDIQDLGVESTIPVVLKKHISSHIGENSITTDHSQSFSTPRCSSASVDHLYTRKVKTPQHINDIRTPHMESPRTAKKSLKFLKRNIELQNKKLDMLRHRLSRREKKINSLTELVSSLQEQRYLDVEKADNLLDLLPTHMASIAMRTFQFSKKKFPPELRSFALTLHFYSPKAYAYVRKTFNNLLPHPATIRKWCCVLDGAPGFTKEVLETLRSLHTSNGQPIICNLVVDEMSIRRKITYFNNRVYGQVDLGFSENLDSNSEPRALPSATKVLVFCLVGLNKHWKCPVGYFLVESLNAIERATLIRQCLRLMHDYHINVHSLTFDGDKGNLATAKHLGAELDVISPTYRSFFYHPANPNQRVYIFLDPCHMLKNVRNAFAEFLLTDVEGNIIDWKLICEIVDIQANLGLRLANKLRKRHIKYGEHIMSVRLAAQTLIYYVKEVNRQHSRPVYFSE